MKNLSKKKYFEYDSKGLLGVMRFDFYDGRLANQWNPRELVVELSNKKLQEDLNHIQFDLINTYEKVVELCESTGYDNEKLLYIDFEIVKYVIKLITR